MRRTKEDAAKTREAVIDAAEAVFFENGVSRSTLEQIAARAGVTRGAVYWHFKDKAEIFKALQERVRLPQEELLIEQALAHGHEDPLSLIDETALSALDVLAKDTRRQRIYTILSHRCEDVGEMAEILVRITDANRAMYNNLLQLMEMAERNGSLSRDWSPPLAVKALQCTFTGLLQEWLRNGKSFSIIEVGARMITGLIQSLRASEAMTQEGRPPRSPDPPSPRTAIA
jgi:TetR/AcrR family transcriptional regulator, acrAB operon repressor